MQTPLPNLILLGVQKSGSTALYDWLSQHPDVFGNPAMKDFPFFCSEKYYSRGLEWFSEQFRGYRHQPVVLHGYVHYLFFGAEVAQRLLEYNTGIKTLLLLRDPVERAYSGFLQARKTGNEPRESFEEALQDDLNGRLERFADRANRSYLTHGLYSSQLEVWLNVFPQEQLHIELFDSIKATPRETCKRVFRHIGVDDSFDIEPRRRNDHGTPRFDALERFVRRGIRSDRLRNLLPLSVRTRLRLRIRALNTVPTEKPALQESTRAFLRDYYAPEIARLKSLTGLDLSAWTSADSVATNQSAPSPHPRTETGTS